MTVARVDLETGEIATGSAAEMDVRTATVNVADLIENPSNKRQPDQDMIDNIADSGLIQPIVVDPGMRIVAGHRRFRACRILGHRTVRVEIHGRLADPAAAVRAEIDENEVRVPFSTLELADATRRLEESLRPAAVERQRATQAQPGNDLAAKDRKKNGGGPAGPPPFAAGKTRDAAAAETGMSPSTYRRIQAIQNAAAHPEFPAEVHQAAAEALDDLTKGGPVVSAWKKVRAAKEAAGILAKKSPPERSSEQRASQIRPLAEQGHSTRQIAEKLGFGEPHIRNICKTHGIDVPADALIGKTRRHDPDRIINHTIHTLDGICMTLDLVDWDKADRTQAKEWVTSLNESLKSLNKMRTRLKEMTQ